jgi:uncharacterized protein (DUF1800 family)
MLAADETSSSARYADPDWAWAVYTPDKDRPWNLALAAHLHRRAGFGAAWAQLQQSLSDGPQRAIDRLLSGDAETPAFNQAMDEAEDAAAQSNSVDSLRAWWLRRMLQSPRPLVERMTLFWHGHFGVNYSRVQSAPLMHRHLALLRSQAMGRYDALLTAIVQDPAVLVAFEGAANHRGMPSRNFAAAVLGPLTLGEGRCSSADLAEAARAFTGQFVQHEKFRFVAREHDPGQKTILGETGNWNAADVARIVLRQPALPRRIVGKLYRWLISETESPADGLLAPLADVFAKTYDIGRLVETMLRSNLFFSPAAYCQRVKSPVEFALGILVGLDTLVATQPLGQQLGGLGQELCQPPTMHGWEGGRAWITRASLLARDNLAHAILFGQEPFKEPMDLPAVAEKHGKRGEAAARFLIDLFLPGEVGDAAAGQLLRAAGQGDLPTRLLRLAHAVVTLPEFQLS